MGSEQDRAGLVLALLGLSLLGRLAPGQGKQRLYLPESLTL